MSVLSLGKLLRPASAGLNAPACYLRRRQERALKRCCVATRSLVLSYDDGPAASLTPALLDLLASYGAKCTFFLLGKRAVEHPEVVDRLVAEGHELGCHGNQHVNAWEVSPSEAVRDLDEGYAAMARWMPPNATFRPPYGKLSVPTWLALRRRGARVGWWTVDSGDTWERMPSATEPVEAVRKAGGGVVLLHDFERVTERWGQVLEMTEALLKAARAEGWAVRQMRDVM